MTNSSVDLADLSSSLILSPHRGPYLLTPIFIFRLFHQMVITETRRVDTSWIVNGELTDCSVLSDELSDFCAQYPIHHVKKAQESLGVTGIETKGEVIEFSNQWSSFGDIHWAKIVPKMLL